MKKRIKADLTDILRLAATYQPIAPEHIEACIAAMCRCERTDFLFLARREKCFLFDLPAVYTTDSYENLTWTFGLATPRIPVIALFLHVTKAVNARPVGTVTLLDYPATARDVEVFSPLPKAAREVHIKDITKHCTKHARYCTILEVIQYLKIGR